jgi:hypothetical protein
VLKCPFRASQEVSTVLPDVELLKNLKLDARWCVADVFADIFGKLVFLRPIFLVNAAPLNFLINTYLLDGDLV